MNLGHPFEWLSPSSQNRAFLVLFIFTLVVLASLQVLGGPLSTEAAPAGVVSFELVGELALAQSMVESWGETGRVYAGLNLGLDYLFMVAYGCAIALGCVLVARSLSQRVRFLSTAGVVLAWAQFGAALLDAVENYALIRVLLGSQQELWPVVALWCAVFKFLIVAVGLVYVLIGAVIAIGVKARSASSRAR